MIEGYKEGDKVRVMVHETARKGSILATELHKYDEITAEIKEIDGNSIWIWKIEEWDKDDDTQVFSRKDAIRPIGCGEKNHDLVYHDRKQEWVCPFCDIEYEPKTRQDSIKGWVEKIND